MCGRLSQYAALHEFVDALSMRRADQGVWRKEQPRFKQVFLGRALPSVSKAIVV